MFNVEEILVENGSRTAVGLRLSNGKVIRATKAVVSNADPFVTKNLLAKIVFGMVRLQNSMRTWIK